ncbi:MAG TPA: hypothetical protein VIK18_01600, partial [Pirellulales bacterium]
MRDKNKNRAGRGDETQTLVGEIHRAARPLVLVVTGGGSGAIAALLERAGASRTVLEATVPYAPLALARWLGATPEQACAPRTARAMAMVAYHRARGYLTGQEATPVGLACTASLATDRPKRGEHRLFVALQSGSSTCEWSLILAKGRRSRQEEETLATGVLLNAAAEACGIQPRIALDLFAGERLDGRRCEAPAGWRQLLAGEIDAADAEGHVLEPDNSAGRAMFPGAFNPLHDGHRRMAEFAAARLGMPVEIELSITNVDKPPLDFLEMRDRAGQFTGPRLWFTNADTFVKKSRIFPGSTFIVGVDTLERIAKPAYYGGETAKRDAAVAEIAGRGCRFLVFGRYRCNSFYSLTTIELPAALAAISVEIPEAEFRQDISST